MSYQPSLLKCGVQNQTLWSLAQTLQLLAWNRVGHYTEPQAFDWLLQIPSAQTDSGQPFLCSTCYYLISWWWTFFLQVQPPPLTWDGRFQHFDPGPCFSRMGHSIVNDPSANYILAPQENQLIAISYDTLAIIIKSASIIALNTNWISSNLRTNKVQWCLGSQI